MAITLNQGKIHKLANAKVPPSLLSHPGMISNRERNFLYNLTKEVWKPGKIIVDAGTFLGASTRVFAEALQQCGACEPAIYSYEYGIFNEYNAKFATQSLGIQCEAGQKYESIVRDLLKDKKELIKYHFGDIQNIKYSDGKIIIAFLDIIKNTNLLVNVVNKFFPYFEEGTILYQQDYFHPNHPWIAYSMAKYSDAFTYVGRPEDDEGAYNAAVFIVKNKSKIPYSIDENEIKSKDEVLKYMHKAIDIHKHPIERLNLIGLRCCAEAAFDKNELTAVNKYKLIMKDYHIDRYIDDRAQQHHINRIMRSVRLFANGNLKW